MSVVCPKCQSTIEDASVGEILCTLCGLNVDSLVETTVDWSRSGGRRTLGKFELIDEEARGRSAASTKHAIPNSVAPWR